MARMPRILPVALAACCIVLVGPGVTPEAGPPESPIAEIPLAGPLAETNAELSGLAWHDDELVLLPQFPSRFSAPGVGGEAGPAGAVFALRRESLRAYLAGTATGPLEPRPVPFRAPGIEDVIPGFEGFEAVAFSGDQVFAVVEADADEGTHGWLLGGRVEPGLAGVTLDVETRARLVPQTDVGNLGYEAVIVTRDLVAVLFEANGATNPAPRVEIFDRSLKPLRELSMMPLEFRVTDATAPDADGRFWVSNYWFEGDTWRTGACPIERRYGLGRSHRTTRTVERIVPMRLTERGVELSGESPLQIELDCEGGGRNWEGLARLDGGFLVVTDEHPRTMLAWVSADR